MNKTEEAPALPVLLLLGGAIKSGRATGYALQLGCITSWASCLVEATGCV